MPKALSPIIRIAKYTLTDEVRQKSFIIMFVICAIFIFLVRGCYQGNYMVNGQALDAGTVVRAVSKVTFHVIAAGVMLHSGVAFDARIQARPGRRDAIVYSVKTDSPVAVCCGKDPRLVGFIGHASCSSCIALCS